MLEVGSQEVLDLAMEGIQVPVAENQETPIPEMERTLEEAIKDLPPRVVQVEVLEKALRAGQPDNNIL